MGMIGRCLLGLAIMIAGMTHPASAERRVALIVGNSAYSGVPALANPANDADDMAGRLRGLGFDVRSGTNLDVAGFDEAVREFARALDGADVALFYYAGHGIQANGENYLLPVDARFDDLSGLKRQAVALADVMEEMQSRARTALVFIDACRDNPLADSLRAKTRAVSRGLARVEVTAKNTLVVFATAPGKVAADGEGRNSPFTKALLDHVDAPGVEVESLMKRVSAAVITATKGAQEPERLSRLTSEFYFVPGGAAGAEVTPPASQPAIVKAPVAVAALRPQLPPPAEAGQCKWFGASAQLRSEGYCATSVLAPQAGNSYGPDGLRQQGPGNAWCEGRAGEGIGETLVFRMDPGKTFTTILIENGYSKSPTIFARNGRPHLVEIRTSDGLVETRELADSAEVTAVDLSREVEASWVSMTILSVYPGSKYNDTCVSYLRPVVGE
jgi:hypothetical protein